MEEIRWGQEDPRLQKKLMLELSLQELGSFKQSEKMGEEFQARRTTHAKA